MIKLITAILIIFTLVNSQEIYQKVIHSTDPDALCLDGSPPLLYYHNGADKNKFLIYFIGNWICTGSSQSQTIDDCYKKTQTAQGSSKYWSDTLSLEGLLSTNSTISGFANWTKIVFGYCDGSFHQGYRKNPIPYRGINIYFRGSLITKSHFTWIMQKYPTFQVAQKIVMAGSSAGGVASYLWTNYVRSLVAYPSNVLTVADSAYFLPFQTYPIAVNVMQEYLTNIYRLANLEQSTPLTNCNQKYSTQSWKCLIFINGIFWVQSTAMFIGSQYDSFAITDTLQIDCLTRGKSQYTLSNCSSAQFKYIQSYRQNFTQSLSFFSQIGYNSIWTIGCSQHSYMNTNKYYNSNNQRVPDKTGLTIKQAVESFIFNKSKVIRMETNQWPNNTGCAL